MLTSDEQLFVASQATKHHFAVTLSNNNGSAYRITHAKINASEVYKVTQDNLYELSGYAREVSPVDGVKRYQLSYRKKYYMIPATTTATGQIPVEDIDTNRVFNIPVTSICFSLSAAFASSPTSLMSEAWNERFQLCWNAVIIFKIWLSIAEYEEHQVWVAIENSLARSDAMLG